MNKPLTLLVIFCLLSPVALAQFTTVTGTVVDPNSIPYSNGIITATLVSSSTPIFTATNLPYAPPTQPVGLNAAGAFVMRLADVTALTPGGSTWTFQVCSAGGTVQPGVGTGPVCFTVTGIAIAGASQDITATLHAAALALTIPIGGGGGAPAGSNQIQFSNAGVFAAISNVDGGSSLVSNGATSVPIFQRKLVVDMRDTSATVGSAGAKCDGVTDDTAAIQAYLTYYGRFGAASPTQNIQFQLPIGQCVISNQLVYEGANNLGMIFAGTKGLSANIGTALVWKGPNFGTMMLVLGCNGCWVQNLDFTPNLSGGGPNHGAQNALWFDSSNIVTQVAYNLAAIARSGNVVTATTTGPHVVTAGRIVKVASSTGGAVSFNGTFQVLYSNDNTHISWIQSGPDESGTPATGTVTNYRSNPANNIKLSYIEVYSPEAVTSTISAISGTNPVLVTTTTPHFIQQGDTVCLRGVTDASYIGCYLATVTSSTTASMVVLANTGTAPSGAASSGGTLISGSSGIRFSHREASTPQVSTINGNDLYIQGDQLGGTANCLEADSTGNTKAFVWQNIILNGCRYGFNGFGSGNFTLTGYSNSLFIPADTTPTLATIDFVNMQGQITIIGGESEAENNRFFGGTGQIHLDGISYQGKTPTDDLVILWGGSLTLTNSFFNDGRDATATPKLECGNPLFTNGACTLTSIGNFYANTAVGGSWSNPGFLPVTNGSTAYFACPGTYCNSAINVMSFGDYGSTSNVSLGSANKPLKNVSNFYTLGRQQDASGTAIAGWNTKTAMLLSVNDCLASWQPGYSLCEASNNFLDWNGPGFEANQIFASGLAVGSSATDNFAGVALDADWTQPPGPWQTFTVAAGVVSPGSNLSNPNALAYWNKSVFSNDQYSQAKVASVNSSWAGPAVRITTGGPIPGTYYGAVWDTANLRLILNNNTGLGYSYTDLATCTAPIVGDTVLLSVQGTSLTLQVNGTPVCGTPLTDTNLASGAPGITAYHSVAGDSALKNWVGGSNSTAITIQQDTGLSRINPASVALGNGAQGDFSGTLKLTNLNASAINGAIGTVTPAAGTFTTVNANTSLTVGGAGSIAFTSNCAAVGSAANPSIVACGGAPVGAFSCDPAATGGTCQVNTTAVTANSRIFVQQSDAEGANLGVTCNTGITISATAPLLASKNAGAGNFIINLGTVTANPACFNFFIVN